MPNWCYTNYVFEGNKDEISDLFKKIESVVNMQKPLVENDFGVGWLGNIVTLFGGDWNEICCRGYLIDVAKTSETTISINTETAWREMYETWNFVCSIYPSVKYYYIAEESGCGYYVTNDKEGKYFAERFIVEQYDLETEYLTSEKDLFAEIGRRTNCVIFNKEEMEKVISDYNTTCDEGNEIYVEEYEVEE